MKLTITLVALLGLVLSFFAVAHLASATVCYTANGCTGTSSPSGILYGDNGSTSHLNTVSIGTGLTFSAGTLSASGSGITQIGPTGQLQSGSTQTIASSTPSFNGLTDGLTITASGNTQTFQPTLTGTLGVAGGGTGNGTYSASQLLYGNGTAALSSVATSTLTCTGVISCTASTIIGTATTISFSGTLSVSNGGTGQGTFTAGQLLYGNGTAALSSVSTSSVSVSPGLANTGTLGALVGGSAATLKQIENRSIPYATSTWTGTTTIPLENGYGELWNTTRCSVQPNGATVGIDFYWHSGASTNHLNYIPTASSTNNVFTFSTNQTITAGATTSVDIGTPTGSPTSVVCTVNDTI